MGRLFSLRLSVILGAVVVLCSCATYNQQNAGFYQHLQEGSYEKASAALDNNRLLKKKRNRLLFLMEKGKLEHMLGNFSKSNELLNEADLLMEDARLTAGDLAAGYLMNPMMQQYKGEPFERYMLHYYKALNFLQLGDKEAALVEARRITIATYAAEDKTANGKYSRDAFALCMQGLIYESAGDWNNSFIAYRNAVEVYLDHEQGFYGVTMPVQLKKDLLRLAYLNGFADQLEYWERKLDMKFDPATLPRTGEVVVFWENGLAPVKVQENLFFNLVNDNSGSYFFENRGSQVKVPFAQANQYNAKQLALLSSLHIVMPRYQQQSQYYVRAMIHHDSLDHSFEEVHDLNDLAVETLRERWLSELGKTLARLAIKRLAELALEPDNSGEKDKEDKKEKKKEGQQALAMGLKVFNLATEKAETRNWQSLPGNISYVRLPLKEGENELKVEVSARDGQSYTRTIRIRNRGGLQVAGFSTLRPQGPAGSKKPLLEVGMF